MKDNQTSSGCACKPRTRAAERSSAARERLPAALAAGSGIFLVAAMFFTGEFAGARGGGFFPGISSAPDAGSFVEGAPTSSHVADRPVSAILRGEDPPSAVAAAVARFAYASATVSSFRAFRVQAATRLAPPNVPMRPPLSTGSRRGRIESRTPFRCSRRALLRVAGRQSQSDLVRRDMHVSPLVQQVLSRGTAP